MTVIHRHSDVPDNLSLDELTRRRQDAWLRGFMTKVRKSNVDPEDLFVEVVLGPGSSNGSPRAVAA